MALSGNYFDFNLKKFPRSLNSCLRKFLIDPSTYSIRDVISMIYFPFSNGAMAHLTEYRELCANDRMVSMLIIIRGASTTCTTGKFKF